MVVVSVAGPALACLGSSCLNEEKTTRMNLPTLSRKRLLSGFAAAAGALALTGTAFACIPMAGELTVEANGTSLTVVGANQGRMGWCGEHADRQFDSSEIPQAAPGDTVSITVKKTKACAQPGEQWNTLGGSTAERFTVDLRNGPAFVDSDVDGDQEWRGGSGCYAGAGGGFAGPVVHLGDFTVNKGGNGKTDVNLPTNLALNGPTDSSILCINDTNTFNGDRQGGMLAPLQIVVL